MNLLKIIEFCTHIINLFKMNVFKVSKSNRIFIAILTIFSLSFNCFSQKTISIENIYKDYRFEAKNLSGFIFLKDGYSYAERFYNNIIVKDIVTGEQKDILLDFNQIKSEIGSYSKFQISNNEEKILLATETENLYRSSSKSFYYVWDHVSSKLTPVLKSTKQQNPSFSPNDQKLAFVAENNLYIKDLKSGKLDQITADGKANMIVNGLPGMYDGEFAQFKAYEWSADGQYLAFIRLDESGVPDFSINYFNNEAYPTTKAHKYPKVGEHVSIVSIYVYNLATKTSKKIEIPIESDDYIPRITWTKDNYHLCVTWLNHKQNELRLYMADSQTGKVRQMYKETNTSYIDCNFSLIFLENGSEYLWSSEKDGYNHLYVYDLKGNMVHQLTKGSWDVTKVYGYDAKRGLVYYQAAKNSPMQKEVYSVNINGENTDIIAATPGTNDVQFTGNYEYYVLEYSNINRPPIYTLYENSGARNRDLETNNLLTQYQLDYMTQTVRFFNFKTSEDISLNGWIIMPPNMDTLKKYPVFMYQYSGPNDQQVTDEWKGNNYWWFQLLAQHGYIVACVDGRGTGARGEAFRKITYKQMGKYETIDQIEAAKYLSKLPYIDASRIGIYGHSFGGFIAALCILKGNDVFKTAIAVAPVTDWRWYYLVYAERYMQTEKENPDGYKDNSPINFADRLKGNLLLIHGTADDIVHFQNSIELSKALIQANKQFESFYYPNGNHSLYGGNANLHLHQKMTDYIYKNL